MPRDQYSPQGDAEPGYCSGNWYSVVAGGTVAGAAVGSNTLRLLPFTIRTTVDIVSLGGRIGTLAVAGFCSFAIYRANAATLMPMARPLATTGPIATDLAVNVNGAIVEGRTRLAPGLYWFGVTADNATVVFQSLASANNDFLVGAPTQDGISSAATVVASHRSFANPGVFGTWPDLTDPALTTVTTTLAMALGQFQVAP